MSKKKSCFIFWSLILLFLVVIQLLTPISTIDDPWTYLNFQNIKNNLIMYKDFGCVTTPFYYYLYTLPILLFDNFISIKIMDIIISFLFLFTLYRLGKKLNLKEINCKIIVLLSSLTCNLITYNGLIQFEILLGIYCLILIDEKKQKRDIVKLSILCSLLILTKQTIGTIIAIVLTIFCFYLLKKIKLKYILSYLLPSSIIGSLFLCWLIINDNVANFFDFCLFGLSRFVDPSYNWETLSALIIVFVTILFCCILTKHKYLIIISIINLFNLINVYPICNTSHCNKVMPLLFLTLFLYINEIKNQTKQKIIQYIYYISILLCFVLIGVGICNYISSVKIESNYISGHIDKVDYQLNKPIIDYMNKNKDKNFYSIEDTYVFHCFMTNRKVNGFWNIYLKGNLGTKDYISIIKELENKKNNYIYIYNDKEYYFWQTPEEPRSYIQKNYKKIDTVGKFDIYKIK